MLGSGQSTLNIQFLMVCLSQVLQELFPVEFTVELVYLWYFDGQFLQITLGKTAHYKQFLQVAFFFFFCKFQNHIDRLFFRVADETAGIDYRYLPFRVFCIMSYAVSCFFQLTHQLLRVY